MKKILLILLVCIGTGCAKTIYVPGPERIRTEYEDKYSRDSIYISDTVLIARTGDTVFIKKYRYIYVDRLKTDTVNTSDSIRIPVPYEDTGKIDKYKKYLKNSLYGNGILFLIICIIVVFHYIKRKIL
ncbi:MAG: hypothetical protein LBN27_11090 [Prevotellaceae bacterium]|jgi:hypothetical protein|nr:hypothetical protein [Prevotellaceae bacterium]